MIWFLVFILALQQVEGQLIYPRVVGNSIGLPGLLVLIAVILGGGLGGIMGIIFAVPVIAILYQLLKEAIDNMEQAERAAVPEPEPETGLRIVDKPLRSPTMDDLAEHGHSAPDAGKQEPAPEPPEPEPAAQSAEPEAPEAADKPAEPEAPAVTAPVSPAPKPQPSGSRRKKKKRR